MRLGAVAAVGLESTLRHGGTPGLPLASACTAESVPRERF
jgi:hypothetical protein